MAVDFAATRVDVQSDPLYDAHGGNLAFSDEQIRKCGSTGMATLRKLIQQHTANDLMLRPRSSCFLFQGALLGICLETLPGKKCCLPLPKCISQNGGSCSTCSSNPHPNGSPGKNLWITYTPICKSTLSNS